MDDRDYYDKHMDYPDPDYCRYCTREDLTKAKCDRCQAWHEGEEE